jgi:Ca-activated chloride channel family protein
VAFLWPSVLWAVLLLAAGASAYARLVRRPTRHPVVLSTASRARKALDAARGRHLPAALVAAAILAALVAAARPVVPLPVPTDRSVIVLAIDVSGSMRSTDIAPSRLEAAQAAAREFLRALPRRVPVGLVVFAGYATLLAPPGTDRGRLFTLIDGIGTARRTAIGEGLLEAVAALPGRSRPTPGQPWTPPVGPLPPAAVILLSDGRSNTGADPLQAAEIAARQQVTVFTVGVGQRFPDPGAWAIGGGIDEETLQAIAATTGGAYYHASSAHGLREVYRRLARTLGWERRPTEVGAVLAAASAALLAAGLVAAWFRTFVLAT